MPTTGIASGLGRISTAYFHDQSCQACTEEIIGQASRLISTGRLKRLPALHLRPIDVVVSNEPSGTEVQGDLILRLASRLDAFSAYLIRT